MPKFITTLEVVKDYFTFRLNESVNLNKNKFDSCKSNCSPVISVIRSLAFDAELENIKFFDEYIASHLHDTYEFENLILKLEQIAIFLFDDENSEIDWSRIIAFVSFASYFSFKYACITRDLDQVTNCTCKLIEWVTTFITCKCGKWIECNGGWESFKNFGDDTMIFHDYQSIQ